MTHPHLHKRLTLSTRKPTDPKRTGRRHLSRFNAPAYARANFRVISCFALIGSPFPMYRSCSIREHIYVRHGKHFASKIREGRRGS